MGRPLGKQELIITINWSCHESHIVTLCRLPNLPVNDAGQGAPWKSPSSVLYPRRIPHRCKEGPRAIAPHGPYVCQCLSYAILAQAENSEHISHWRAAKMAGGISPGTFGIPEIFRVDWVEWMQSIAARQVRHQRLRASCPGPTCFLHVFGRYRFGKVKQCRVPPK